MKRTVIVLAALALTLAACGGGGDDGAVDEGDGSGDFAAPGAAAEGEPLFGGTCATCHGADALGIEGLGKSLVANEFVASQTDAELVAFIQEGRPAGDPLNTTGVDMPRRGGNPALTDQDLADIVAYVRTLE